MAQFMVEIPDWAIGRHLYLFAGIELVAFQLQGEKEILLKSGRCSGCGKCCMSFVNHKFFFKTYDGGVCEYLRPRADENGEIIEGHECALGVGRPFFCGVGDGNEKNPTCTVKYRKVKIMEKTKPEKETTNTVLQVEDGVIKTTDVFINADVSPKKEVKDNG